MSRTTQEVFQSHKEALETGNFDKMAADYADDAVLITLDGSFVGRQAILNEFFLTMFGQFPDAKINFEKSVIKGDTCLLQWSAKASAVSIPKGIAVFLIRDGLIQRQGEWFEMVPNG